MSRDSDFFGFPDLIELSHGDDGIKLINDFHFKTKMNGKRIRSQSVTFTYYHSAEVWKSLGLHSIDQRLELICLVGNDFVEKRTASEVLQRCGVDEGQSSLILLQNQSDPLLQTDGVESVNSNTASHIAVESEEKEPEISMDSLTTKMDELNVSNKTAAAPRWKWKYDVIEVAANAILKGTVEPPLTVPDVVKDFYSIDTTQELVMESNVNPVFSDLMTKRIFNGGFLFHDIDTAGYCIHQKLGPLRHALIRKYLKLDVLNEYIPEITANGDDEEKNGDDVVIENVNVWKYRLIDLRLRRFDDADLAVNLLTEEQHEYSSNLLFVFKHTLRILSDRRWIDRVQSVALELQFQIRSPSGLSRVYRNDFE